MNHRTSNLLKHVTAGKPPRFLDAARKMWNGTPRPKRAALRARIEAGQVQITDPIMPRWTRGAAK